VPFSAQWVNPFRLPQALTSDISEKERESARYIRYRSILAYPMYMVGDAVRSASLRTKPDHLTESDTRELQKIIGPVQPANTPHGNLLIVLMESFESWLIDAQDADGNPICPELVSYIKNHPIVYVRDIESQIQYGMSGDGQLIINTGLYPTKEDVACVEYGHNTYPNLAHFYPHSAIVNPCRNVWNQTVVAASYGYQRLVEPQTEYRFEWNDSIVVDKIIETMDALSTPACVMGITVSGHLPFTSSPDDIAIADSIPELFRHYLQTAHFTDQQLGRLLAWADTAQVMHGSTIVITGDHRIFHAWFNDEVRDYGLRTNLPFGTGQAGCPLIIKSPGIKKQLVIERGKQIDIYTTILNLIGQDSYFWKGMGHCLITDESSTETEYYIRRDLSDKLIRMNYFEKYE